MNHRGEPAGAPRRPRKGDGSRAIIILSVLLALCVILLTGVFIYYHH